MIARINGVIADIGSSFTKNVQSAVQGCVDENKTILYKLQAEGSFKEEEIENINNDISTTKDEINDLENLKNEILKEI